MVLPGLTSIIKLWIVLTADGMDGTGSSTGPGISAYLSGNIEEGSMYGYI